MLAVLAAGGVHAPLDHRMPAALQQASARELGLSRWLRLDATQPGQLALAPGPCAFTGDPLLAQGRHAAFLRASSGTTGTAKGVLLSHEALAERIAIANAGLGLGPEDRVLWLLPMAWHVAVSLLLYIEVGASLVCGAALRAADSAAIARRHRCTMAYVSPWQVSRYAELETGALGAEMSQVVATTAALDAATADAFRARHPGLRLRQALGIIEVGLPLVSAGLPGEEPGAYPPPVAGVDCVVIDADSGAELAPGLPGELAIRAPGLCDAYLEPWRPQSALLDAAGRFRSGDAALRAADGGIRLLGRLKEVIAVAGTKVFPLVVEAALAAHPGVAACRVRGQADALRGELVLAEVVPVPGQDPVALEASLASWCRTRLPPLAVPARYRVQAALPQTASGKVRRA